MNFPRILSGMIFTFGVCGVLINNCNTTKEDDTFCFTNETYYRPPAILMINSTIHVNKFLKVDEIGKTIQFSVELITSWYDFGVQLVEESKEYLVLPVEALDEIWHPGMYFENLAHLERTKTYGSFKQGTLFLSNDHTMEYTEELTLIIFCEFEFSYFPFDEQYCEFIYGDDDHGTSEVILGTANVAYDNLTVEEEKSIILQHLPFPFILEISPIPTFERTYEESFSYTGMSIKLKRKSLGQLLSGYFYPTASFALLSMISFLIKPEVVPGRMGMIVTLYLISTNVYNSVDAPPSRGFSYIEVWMLGTQIPIIVALLEYGYVLHLKKKFSIKKIAPLKQAQTEEELDSRIQRLDYKTCGFTLIFFLIFSFMYLVLPVV